MHEITSIVFITMYNILYIFFLCMFYVKSSFVRPFLRSLFRLFVRSLNCVELCCHLANYALYTKLHQRSRGCTKISVCSEHIRKLTAVGKDVQRAGTLEQHRTVN